MRFWLVVPCLARRAKCGVLQQSAFAECFGVTALVRDNDPDGLPIVARNASEGWWAHKGSNLGPLPCEGNALPLSYAPGILARDQRPETGVGSNGASARARDLRSEGYRCQAVTHPPGRPAWPFHGENPGSSASSGRSALAFAED